VLAAKDLMMDDFGVVADVWSVTSFNELRRDALEIERWNHLHPEEKPRKSWIQQCFRDRPGPYVAATDYMKIVADQIQSWVPGRFYSLGTDGYGRSDARKELREHFEVDRRFIAVTALNALADDDVLDRKTVVKAIEKYGIDPDRPDPVTL
jgi:pyruvate dehydrogenase E1 component